MLIGHSNERVCAYTSMVQRSTLANVYVKDSSYFQVNDQFTLRLVRQIALEISALPTMILMLPTSVEPVNNWSWIIAYPRNTVLISFHSESIEDDILIIQ